MFEFRVQNGVGFAYKMGTFPHVYYYLIVYNP